MKEGAAKEALGAHLERLAGTAEATAEELPGRMAEYARRVRRTLDDGGKLLFCGNGGSASTAEHVAAEYVVRFRRQRRALPALALSANSAAITAAANDLGFERVFARQVRALAGREDLVVLHSTSGDSENLCRAARVARELDVDTVGVLASGGGRLRDLVQLALVVPTDVVAHAQELHLALEHAVVDHVEAAIANPREEET